MQISAVVFVLVLFVACGAGLAVGFFLRNKLGEARLESAEQAAEKTIAEAKKKAEMVEKEAQLQAKDTLYQTKADFDKEMADKRTELQRLEKRLLQREENIDKKVDILDSKEIEINKKEETLTEQEKAVKEQDKKYQALLAEEKTRLEKVAKITSEEAKKLLLERMENEARHDAAKRIKGIEDELKEQAAKKAKEIISLAVQRYAGEYVMEKTVSLVNLPNEEMKGRIIGREGRNIRALEAATGVDLIIDDTPEAVIISGFNPVRREIARTALERLISDGRIHPARIEEIVAKVEQEIEAGIKEAGEQATFDVGVHGLHADLIKLIGKLKYRTSFAQNVYQHSLEVAFLSGIMASELNLDVKQARRAGLLHDIGKAMDHEVEGAHAAIGADLAKKYGESQEVVDAIAAHHDEADFKNILAVLVQAADALSGARPGARREMFETYVKRLEDLEKVANSFSGVEKSYAIQAGREVRIIVQNEQISEEESVMLSQDIARKIEKELNYPGQIKVTVIRETRAVEYAK
jgi:ribonucrease Y